MMGSTRTSAQVGFWLMAGGCGGLPVLSGSTRVRNWWANRFYRNAQSGAQADNSRRVQKEPSGPQRFQKNDGEAVTPDPQNVADFS